MSDFDEEAERRRLREKFDRDREKRQETARMSELLLKGATMTNQHCETCGDPIFRYRGQEFCPTCAGGDVDAAEAADANAAGAADADDAAGSDETAVGEPSASTAGMDAPAERPDAEAATDGTAAESDVSEPADRQPDAAEGSSTVRRSPTSTPAEGVETPAPSPAPSRAGEAAGGRSTGDGAADLDAARASLVRTLTRHARRAEELDDPRRATEHLGVVREAAEALAAIDETR